ncbi:MAG: D-alanyl-D-alanine carboxypeptidase family protein [Ruminococcus sp.]|nr:D-alanyl-D-alanine carboxypeptidase family protein [Ruminococcus sp.]
MKKYNTIACIVSVVLLMSTLSACSQISNNLDGEESLETQDTTIGQEDTTTTQDIQASITTISTDVTTTVSNNLTVLDESSTSSVVTDDGSSTLSTTTASAIPVDGIASSSGSVVQSISLSKTSVTIEVGESDMPIVTMYPTDADDKSEIWNTSNPQIATVDDKGNITGISEGSCTVTVTAKANTSVYAEISVTVVAKQETQQNTDDTVTEPTYIDGILIVNKTYALPSDYNPYDGDIAPEVQEAFNTMEQDARAEGLTLYISSGFRSYDYQAGLYERYAQRDGYDKADTYSARAGHSEHQTGLCFDLNTIDDSFADTAEGKWVAENCYKYGFIVRYPEGKEDKTGYQYEPWHLRYLGVELATKVYNSGLCLEEYLGITSEYAD